MSVTVRLQLLGKKKQPIYRIVVVEKKSKRNGKYIDSLGFYNPNIKGEMLVFDNKKYQQWVLKGAQTSFGLYKILKKDSHV